MIGMIQMSTRRHRTFCELIGQKLFVAMLATIHSPLCASSPLMTSLASGMRNPAGMSSSGSGGLAAIFMVCRCPTRRRPPSPRQTAKSCPTDSIQFGELSSLHARAAERVRALHEAGATDAYLYGAPGTPGATGNLGHLHAFFLLTARPEVYDLPAAASRGAERMLPSLIAGLATAIVLNAAVFGLLAAAS
jgi:hypothetical protein